MEHMDTKFWEDAERHLIRYGTSFSPRVIERAAGADVYDDEGEPNSTSPPAR